MADVNDNALIQEYADRNSESAFAALVQRHVNLVYSVALRYVGNSQDAQDVTQAVFIILARKAGSLRRRSILTGWLYETTRLTARQLWRTKGRQQAREQEAYMQSILDQSGNDAMWRQLAPHLEAAMSRLRAADRELLALRFYENKTGAEAAALLGIGAEAAHKRTNRALEKLRKFFAKRGVDSTAATIAGTISANSVHAAPVALAKAVTAVAVAKGTAASGSTLILVKGALKLMAWAKAQTAIGATAGILLAGGAATVVLSSDRTVDNLSPDQIFNKAQEKYASLTSYSDEGKTVATMNGSTSTATFTIRLGRPNLYRIEWEQNNGTAFPTAKAQAVWSAGAGDFLTMGFGVKSRTTQKMALGGIPGISSSEATTIPATFFKMALSDQLGGAAAGEKRQADEKVGDVDCYVLVSALNGTTKTLWIGKRDFLIHQVRTATSDRPGYAAPPPLAAPANIRLETIAAMEKAGFPGITSTETHMNIVINQSFSKTDFDYQTSTTFQTELSSSHTKPTNNK